MKSTPSELESKTATDQVVNARDPVTPDEWIAQYSESHQNPVNRACHMFGIPMIALSVPLSVVLFFRPAFWPVPAGLFVLGWILQFVGHAFEGKPPEFLKDKRFLLVGLRWWFSKLRRSK